MRHHICIRTASCCCALVTCVPATRVPFLHHLRGSASAPIRLYSSAREVTRTRQWVPMLCAASQLVQSQGLHGSLLASLVLGPPVTLEAEINSAMSELWTISELWTMKGRRRDPAVFLDVFRLWRSEVTSHLVILYSCFRRFAKPESARAPRRRRRARPGAPRRRRRAPPRGGVSRGELWKLNIFRFMTLRSISRRGAS